MKEFAVYTKTVLSVGDALAPYQLYLECESMVEAKAVARVLEKKHVSIWAIAGENKGKFIGKYQHENI